MRKARLASYTTDELLAIGATVATRMSAEELTTRGLTLLELASAVTPHGHEIDQLLATVKDREEWFRCRDLFRAIRARLLEKERSDPNDTEIVLLSLAEIVVKIAANVFRAGSFDADTSSWLPYCAQRVFVTFPSVYEDLRFYRSLDNLMDIGESSEPTPQRR
jgi:hypothetical protein